MIKYIYSVFIGIFIVLIGCVSSQKNSLQNKDLGSLKNQIRVARYLKPNAGEAIDFQSYKDALRFLDRKTGETFEVGGKCYTRCQTGVIMEVLTGQYNIYTGNDKHIIETCEQIKVITKPSSGEWVKKRAKNCVSANPEDCYIACYEEIPAVIDTLSILIDTTQVKQFEVMIFEPEQNIKVERWNGIVCELNEQITQLSTSGIKFMEDKRIEIVCKDNITNALLENVKGKLISEGYMTVESSKSIRVYLSKYQKDKKLPIGQLDLETLKDLEL